MKFGFDLHGTIDYAPKYFSYLTRALKAEGHKIYVLTGIEDNVQLRKTLLDLGISYDLVFSITSYHMKLGTPMSFIGCDFTQPRIDDNMWNRSKADFCKKHNLSILVDDSDIYGTFFSEAETKYVKFDKDLDYISKVFLKYLSPSNNQRKNIL